MFSDWIDSVYFNTFVSVATLQTLAVISPGPDFAVVTRNSILHSRRVGVYTALGVTSGVLVHLSYLVLGFGMLASNMVKFLFYIKIAGCLYLGYIGWKSLRSAQSSKVIQNQDSAQVSISARSAFWNGFLTNVLNPKAILFLLSLFTVVIDKSTPQNVLWIFGVMIIAITLVWFLIVSLSFSGALRDYIVRFSIWIDRLTGGFLLFVGAKMGLTCFD